MTRRRVLLEQSTPQRTSMSSTTQTKRQQQLNLNRRRKMQLSKEGKVKKGWGEERIARSTPNFCLKDLVFDKAGNKCSLHYHEVKREEFKVLAGSFEMEYCYGNIKSHGPISKRILKTGDFVYIEPFTLHRMIALEDASIIQEVSTGDYVEDSVRVAPGDSQHRTADHADHIK